MLIEPAGVCIKTGLYILGVLLIIILIILSYKYESTFIFNDLISSGLGMDINWITLLSPLL